MQPLVSVIIPAYNGEEYLNQAIDSVLMQTEYDNYEIIVIDNASTDKTAAIATAYAQVKYHYLEIADTCRARNYGISVALGRYIAFLDQDDKWAQDKLNKQVIFLENNLDYAAVIGLQQMYLENPDYRPSWLKQELLDKPQCGYLPSALMIRRSVLEETGYFDITYSLASDVEWFFKAQHSGMKIGNIAATVVYRRIHQHNTSENYQILHKQILAVIKDSLHRRRGSSHDA